MTGELDDTLLDVVCERLDADPLPERAEGLLLAAVEGDDALERAVGGETRRRPSAGNSGPAATPAGAYLAGLQVAGFRGIGPVAALTFSPGPGLTLVVGRNGSGKSSFAEALEVLVTGDVRRWADRSMIWREGCRNLHMTEESVIGDAYWFPSRPSPWVEAGAMTTQPRERDGRRARERPVVAERHRQRERARHAPRRPTCRRDRERGR